LVVDTRPQDGDLAVTTSPSSEAAAAATAAGGGGGDGRLQELSFELTEAKLNVLVHELMQAKEQLNSLK